MSVGRSTCRSGVATVPTLSLSTTLGQLKLSVATLVLHLNNYHLVQDGNKVAKVQRLYSHLQSMQDTRNSNSSGSISGSPLEDEHPDDATPSVGVTGSLRTACRSRPQTTSLHSPATCVSPFTKAQQRALTATIISAFKESRQHKRPRSQCHHSPTISYLVCDWSLTYSIWLLMPWSGFSNTTSTSATSSIVLMTFSWQHPPLRQPV